MSKEMGNIKDLKKGRYVLIDDVPCKVLGVIRSKPGKHGGMKAKVDAVGIFDGQKRSLMGPVDQKVEIPIINKETAQVLNVLGDKIQLMDMSTYETFELELPGDLKGSLSQGDEIQYVDVMGRKKIWQKS